MKTPLLLLLLAVFVPLWAIAQVEVPPTAPPTAKPSPPAAKPPFNAPQPGGTVGGRYRVEALNNLNSSANIAIRVDTFTGQTWTLQHIPIEVKNADGTTTTRYYAHWKECLEPEGMEWLQQQQSAPSAAPH